MCVLCCSEGKRVVSIAGLLAVESAHLAHSHLHPLPQKHWTKLNCWARDICLFGSTVEVVTPLAHFQNLSQQDLYHLILLLHHCHCQQSVQMFYWAAPTMSSFLVDS